MNTIRIAAVTEDGERLSAHFGMAPLYCVFTIEDNTIVAEETRSKPSHTHHAHDHTSPHHDHADMFAPIRDCQVLLAGGMGEPAYQKALAAGLQVILTGGTIQNALQAWLKGELQTDLRRIHHR
jgi:predicted Fe-Mo cluster-binding NifX family protein